MKKRILIVVLLAVLAAGTLVYFAFPGLMYRANIGFSRCRAGLDRKGVQVSDHMIAYLEGGEGPAVVLLHGFGSEKDHWNRFAKHLTPRYRVIIPDIPGFGESSKIPAASYDIKKQAARIEDFCAIMGLEKFHLAGNSMGGFIAGVVAAEIPGKILSLCLIDSSGVLSPRKSEFQLALQNGENPLLVNSVEGLDRMFALNFNTPPAVPMPVKIILTKKAIDSRAFNRKVERDRINHPLDLRPLLGRITAPVLIIWGDDDRVLDKSAIPVLQKGLARSTAVIIKDCGHVPLFEKPEETAKHYLYFLEKR